jgi:diguanylate cyclase (GGDEF)-like protein
MKSELDEEVKQVVGVMGLRDWFRSASLSDLLTGDGHSVDFGRLRSEYISSRVRLLAFLFAVLAPLWIPIDYHFLEPELFLSLFAMRLAYSGAYLGLAVWSGRPGNLLVAQIRLALFLIIPGLFYVGSDVMMQQYHAREEVLIGYTFLPFLMVALLAVFPLTLFEGIASVALIFIFVVAVEGSSGTLFALSTLGDLWLMALLAAIALWAELTQLHMLLRLYREATHDPLTRLVNRRVLTRWLTTEVPRAQAEGRSLSVLLFDLDLFKRINDNYGHLVGDAVLRAFGELLMKESGSSMVGRYGGEEFLAILPGVGAGEALILAERIRQGCHTLRIPAGGGRVISFTTSVGVAELAPGEDPETLISRVDKGLYLAKESGRDLVAVAAPAGHS